MRPDNYTLMMIWLSKLAIAMLLGMGLLAPVLVLF